MLILFILSNHLLDTLYVLKNLAKFRLPVKYIVGKSSIPLCFLNGYRVFKY